MHCSPYLHVPRGKKRQGMLRATSGGGKLCAGEPSDAPFAGVDELDSSTTVKPLTAQTPKYERAGQRTILPENLTRLAPLAMLSLRAPESIP